MNPSVIHSHIPGRGFSPLVMTQDMVAGFEKLSKIGINFPQNKVREMMRGMGYGVGMDALQALVTTGNIGTPVQFLQTFLPGFVHISTAARKIDVLVGMTTVGAWKDEEVVQGVLEATGTAVPYGDYTNVPLSSFNVNFERRTIVRFEEGMQVGVLEEERSGVINLNTAASKREAATMALEIQRNKVGFFGYNSGNNRTYGFTNDPNLPAYVGVANPGSGTTWATKTFLQITADIRTAIAALLASTQEVVDVENDPLVLAIATNAVVYLTTTSDLGYSVRKWMKETYPNIRIESAPELSTANGGAGVFYLYAEKVNDSSTDGGRVFDQIVPAKFQVIGVEKNAKNYVEDYSNAMAGILLKRPFAVVRYSGIS